MSKAIGGGSGVGGVGVVAWQGWSSAPQVSMDQVRGVRGWVGDGCRAVAVSVAGAAMVVEWTRSRSTPGPGLS
jgi:hypothetical protein